jgi:hypothetical protein
MTSEEKWVTLEQRMENLHRIFLTENPYYPASVTQHIKSWTEGASLMFTLIKNLILEIKVEK